MSQQTKHIVLVGDGRVGKTCLLHTYSNKAFPGDYLPTIYNNESFELTIGNVKHLIKLHDTAGQEEYNNFRKQFYMDASCFILCYCVENRTTYENLQSKWIPELRQAADLVPIVLVATKVDLRLNNEEFLTKRDGESLRNKINANAFIECSAKENFMVKEVIEAAVKASEDGISNRTGGYFTSKLCWCCHW